MNEGPRRNAARTGPARAGRAASGPAAEIQQLLLDARRELEMARKQRAEAGRYQRETATRARSEAQALVLKTRIATRREIDALLHDAAEEIQKVLADIRVIRVTAQEELAALHRLAGASSPASRPPDARHEGRKPETKKTKEPSAA